MDYLQAEVVKSPCKLLKFFSTPHKIPRKVPTQDGAANKMAAPAPCGSLCGAGSLPTPMAGVMGTKNNFLLY